MEVRPLRCTMATRREAEPREDGRPLQRTEWDKQQHARWIFQYVTEELNVEYQQWAMVYLGSRPTLLTVITPVELVQEYDRQRIFWVSRAAIAMSQVASRLGH